MNPDSDLQPHALPSKRKLATTTAIAVLVAVALLVTIVLPAEYGIDPIGTGAALGLASLSAPASPPQEVAAPANATTLTPVQEGPAAHYAAELRRVFSPRRTCLLVTWSTIGRDVPPFVLSGISVNTNA